MAINPLSYSDVGPTAVDKINGNLNTLQGEIDAQAGSVTAEQQARTAADQQQSAAITQAQQALADALKTLQGAITTETQARSQADTALGQQVTAEAQARAGGDAAEAQARTAADNALSDQAAAEARTRAAADAAEAFERQAGDQRSLDAIAAEARARGSVASDLAALSAHVDTVTATEAAARRAVSDALIQEVKAREALAASLDDASAGSAADVAAEASARAALGDRVTAEVGARTVATEALSQRLDEQESSLQAVASESALVRTLSEITARPGDDPSSFTGDLTTLASSLPANIAPASIATGRRMRITGSGVLAPVALRAVEAGRLVKVRAVVRRYVDTLDPAGDAIGLFLAWYRVDRSMLPVLTQVAIARLTADFGPMQLGALVSPDIGDASTIRPPAGAAYLRPVVQTWGDTPVTDVEVIETTDVTDFGGVSVDLDAVVNRLASVETRQAAIPGQVRRRSFVRAMMYGG